MDFSKTPTLDLNISRPVDTSSLKNGMWARNLPNFLLPNFFWDIFEGKKLLLMGRVEHVLGYISAAAKDILKILKSAKNLAKNGRFMYIRSSWYLLPQAGNVKNKFLEKVQKLAKNGHISASRVPENPKNARLHWFWVQTVHWVEFHQNRSRWPYPGVWSLGTSALKVFFRWA